VSSLARVVLRDLELLRFVESEPFRGARFRAVWEEELAEICLRERDAERSGLALRRHVEHVGELLKKAAA
jgi:DNA-binding GntR family transcriptional regulator